MNVAIDIFKKEEQNDFTQYKKELFANMIPIPKNEGDFVHNKALQLAIDIATHYEKGEGLLQDSDLPLIQK